jgi:hypothetical protein
MIVSSSTSPVTPEFARVCWRSQERYANCTGHQFAAHSVSRAMGDFEHRIPVMLGHPDDVMLYLEWDIFAEEDAADLTAMLGDNDIMLPAFGNDAFNTLCPALRFPWHIIGVMLVRRGILAELERIRSHCHPYARRMPSVAAHYECTVLMAIQQGGFKLGTFTPHVHRFCGDSNPAWFRHFEGQSKNQIIHHASSRP